MNRPAPLMSLDDALTHLLQAAVPVAETEWLPTLDAAGRVLAEPLASTINVPATDKSERDGWAIRVNDLTEAHLAHSAPRFLSISQRIPAGQPAQPLEASTVARIFTGADLPDGADAVVMQEDAAESDAGVSFPDIPTVGQWIRRAGEDIRVGSVILPAGSRLTPQAAGLAASVGAAALLVKRRLRVACFFTGNELVAPGQPLPPGAIYESNRFVLINLLRNLGCEVQDLGLIPDALDATRVTLREAARGADLIVSSGGMSVGEEDHVKPAVLAEGKLALWQVAMKPGKPLAFGAVHRPDGFGSAHFIGLPGNPVSSLVTFLIAVRPLILRLQGVADVTPQSLMMEAHFDWPRPDRRREFLRASIDAQGGLILFPNQGPAVLTSTVASDGLIDCPAGHVIARGDRVRFLPFDALLH
jgi:molybdopterin molybdotransferase